MEAEHGLKMAELAGKYLQTSGSGSEFGVVGFDVAGDEGTYPLKSENDKMFPGVIRAQELRVPVTIHAGEWPEKQGTLENIKFAVEKLKIERIGHGIALRSDVDLIKTMAVKNTPLTIEVTSKTIRYFLLNKIINNNYS
jgi:adenosine deaminase